ncbi:hypothetical protein KEM56_006719 [Ascosphaera pollenicola]|nr:hypothetical protein KEM56_006719 [Ascosphaera pollenicola]
MEKDVESVPEKAIAPSFQRGADTAPAKPATSPKRCSWARAAKYALSAALAVSTVSYFAPCPVARSLSWLSYLPGPTSLPSSSWPASHGVDFDTLKQILLDTPDPQKVRDWNQYYASGPHLTGKNISQAVWTQQKWQEWGLDVDIATYDVYLNYPREHRLALLNTTNNQTQVTYEASLEEDVLEEDPTSGLEDRVPTFHGYSASGNVTAPYVYANFGRYKDYEALIEAGIDLTGKIVIVKYGHCFRGLKIKRAEELGAVGVIIYTDPQEDGDITEANGFDTYPNGPARNPSAVQRGSVQYLSFAPGDPTTIGYPSLPGVERQDTVGHIPTIPSIPISYQDAIPLLKVLNGHGPKAEELGSQWEGGALGYKGVEYNVGPTPDDVVINLYNDQEYKITPMWNVIGVMEGLIPDEVIVVGNHRDSWIAGGAVDPNSGSATMNEVIRSFGEAKKQGWKPLRTVIFASWDGEEYGLLGSTEWVEDKLSWLKRATVAYLNVDVSTAGTKFGASASPLLNKAIYYATSQVQSPNQTVEGQTVRDLWDEEISTMGSGSDFTAFQDYAGIPSMDIGFTRDSNDAVYHYHSNYDSFAWVDKFGDPSWGYHIACSKVLSLTIAYLSENPIIAFNAVDYAKGLEKYVDSVRSSEAMTTRRKHFSLWHLDRAVEHFRKAAVKFDAYVASLKNELQEDLPWWRQWRRARTYLRIHAVNKKLQYLERSFLHEEGLDGRDWFKHVIFAPGLWTGYSGAVFPGLIESLEAGHYHNAERWAKIIGSKIHEATKSLRCTRESV